MSRCGIGVAERRVQRLEDRYRRAELALAAASARYSTLRGAAGATRTQLLYAARCVEEARQYLLDLQTALEYAKEHPAADFSQPASL